MLQLMNYHQRPACSSKRWSSWPRHASVNGRGSHRFRRPRSVHHQRIYRVVFHTVDRVLNQPADEMVDFATSYPSTLSLSTSFYRKYKSVHVYPNSIPLTINTQKKSYINWRHIKLVLLESLWKIVSCYILKLITSQVSYWRPCRVPITGLYFRMEKVILVIN